MGFSSDSTIFNGSESRSARQELRMVCQSTQFLSSAVLALAGGPKWQEVKTVITLGFEFF